MNLRRPWRDWLGDLAVTAGAVLLGTLMLLASLSDFPEGSKTAIPQDIALGAASCAILLLWRRRYPVAVALVMIALQLTAATVLGTAAAAVFSVAMLRPWRTSIPVAGTAVLAVVGLFWLAPLSEREFQEGVVSFGLLYAVLVSSGMLVRSRRQLIASLKERARAAETEQRLRVEEARLLERERIAREMHDVLAHRISLLAVHAGALEFRPDAPADQREAAGVIRQSAYEAMEDLREVIGVLRADTPGGDPERPQPTLADVSGLVRESRRAGGRVSLDENVPEPGRVPPRVGRHAYRIVQEGLTNARKHAPSADVRVRLDAGTDLDIEIVNALPPGPPPALTMPASGAGQIGRAHV